MGPPQTEFAHGMRRFGALLMMVTLVLIFMIFAVNVYMNRPVLHSLPKARSACRPPSPPWPTQPAVVGPSRAQRPLPTSFANPIHAALRALSEGDCENGSPSAAGANAKKSLTTLAASASV